MSLSDTPNPADSAQGTEKIRGAESQGQSIESTPTTPKSSSVALPWTLVVVLSLVSGVLAGILVAQSSELARLRGDSAPAPSASESTAVASQPAENPSADETGGLPKPVTKPEALKITRELPRRTADDPLALGKTDAPVVLTVWSDFRCPFCSKWERETLAGLKPYIDSGSLRIEHRDLVLFGEDSQRAAVAARAAGKQGKFWEFSSLIAKAAPPSGHPPIDEATVTKYATELGLDMTKFKADLSDPAVAEAIKADVEHAKTIGVDGTPFFLINDTPINGAQPTEIFTGVIESYGGKK